MKFTVRVSLLLAVSSAVYACSSDSAPNDAGGRAGAGGVAGGGGTDAPGGSAGNAGAADSAGAAGNGEGGSGEGGEAGVDAGPLTPMVQAFCGAARSCCSSGDALAKCERNFSAQVDAVALVLAGKLELDPTALAACVAAYQSAKSTCTLAEVRSACHGVFVGKVPDGGSCSSVLECDRGSAPKVCLRLGGEVMGTCVAAARGEAGTVCAGSCARGEICSTTTFASDASVPTALCHEEDGLYCPIGEGCAPLAAEGEECTWDEACGSAGFCVSTCNPKAQLGAPCQFDYGCARGLACRAGKCGAEPFETGDVCLGTPPALD